MTLLIRCQVLAFEIHHDEVLLADFLLVNEVVDLNYSFIVDQLS